MFERKPDRVVEHSTPHLIRFLSEFEMIYGPETALRICYWIYLKRPIDADGLRDKWKLLSEGVEWSLIVESIIQSSEFQTDKMKSFRISLPALNQFLNHAQSDFSTPQSSKVVG